MRSSYGGVPQIQPNIATSSGEQFHELLELLKSNHIENITYHETHKLSESGEDVLVTYKLSPPVMAKPDILGLQLNLCKGMPYRFELPADFDVNTMPGISLDGRNYKYTAVEYIPKLPSHRSFPSGIYPSEDQRNRDIDSQNGAVAKSNLELTKYNQIKRSGVQFPLGLSDRYYLAQERARWSYQGEKLTDVEFRAVISYDRAKDSLVCSTGESLEEFNASNRKKLQQKQDELRAAKLAAQEAKEVFEEQRIKNSLERVRAITRERNVEARPSWWKRLCCTRVRQDSGKRKREYFVGK